MLNKIGGQSTSHHVEPKHRNWTAVISQKLVRVEILHASRENIVQGAATTMLEICHRRTSTLKV